MFEGIAMGIAVSALALAIYAHMRIEGLKPKPAQPVWGNMMIAPEVLEKVQGPSGHIFHGHAHNEKPHSKGPG